MNDVDLDRITNWTERYRHLTDKDYIGDSDMLELIHISRLILELVENDRTLSYLQGKTEEDIFR